VYGIVKQSNGYIWVYSDPFRGTAVKIYFPSVDQPAESLVPSRTNVSLPVGIETILLVEDDEALRKVTTSLLELSGYKVLEANNAASAIELSHRHEGEIALLLSDVIMPGKSGPDLALDVKRHRPDISVLYASGYTGDIIAHQGVLDPGIKLLSKPFSKETLLKTVRTVLDEKTALPPAVIEASSPLQTTPVGGDPQVESRPSVGGHTRKIRQRSRFKLNVDLNIQSPTQSLVPATSLDISESGLSAVLPLHLPVGEIVELSFDLPTQHMRLSAAVRQNHAFRYGFEFVKPDDATLRTIRESSRLLEKLEG
jgi:CheY-like chemotaxis protein